MSRRFSTAPDPRNRSIPGGAWPEASPKHIAPQRRLALGSGRIPYGLAGIIYWPAHILFLIGAGKCLAGRIKGAALLSVLAMVAGVLTGGPAVAEQFQKSTLLKYPAFPLWLVSLLMLMVLAVVLDLSSTARGDNKAR